MFVFKYFAHVDDSFFEVASKLLQASIIADPENHMAHYWQGMSKKTKNKKFESFRIKTSLEIIKNNNLISERFSTYKNNNHDKEAIK